MKLSVQVQATLKETLLLKIAECLQDEEVLRTGSNVLAIPFEHDGEEGYYTITVSIPRGSRDGTLYDGHHEAECYTENVRQAELKRQMIAEKKAKKKALTTQRNANTETVEGE